MGGKSACIRIFTSKFRTTSEAIGYIGLQISQLNPSTPLTGRKYLQSKEPESNVTPVSTATQSVQRLQSLLGGRQPAPSPWLAQLIELVHSHLTVCFIVIAS